MGPYGSLCVHMDFNGSLWVPIVPCAFLWIVMGPYEFLWVLMSRNVSFRVLIGPYGSYKNLRFYRDS